MATLHVDGVEHEVPEGQNLLEACLKLGYDLPYFCWHPALGSVGACRQCAVTVYDDEGNGRLEMACMTPCKDGTKLSIDDDEAAEFREAVVEWLMVNHPHDCPVCDEGGECHLQDMTVMTGHSLRKVRFPKRTFRNMDLGPFLHHEMNRCIHCYRCVRFYADHAGGGDLAAFGCHDHVWFGRHEPGAMSSPFAGNLVEVCPTGVFTDKPQRRHYTRKWDLQTAPGVCQHCAVGCNTAPGERQGTLRRIRNRHHPEVNGWFLCDRGRFGYGFVDRDDRIRAPEGEVAPLPAGATVVGIGSDRASLESNFALQRLVGPDRFFADLRGAGEVLRLLRGPAPAASLADVEASDAVLVLGEDPLHTAPRLALALRQAARTAPTRRAMQRLGVHDWHDQAVRRAVGEDTGPFFVATPAPTDLDELGEALRLAPSDTARLGRAIAAAVREEGRGQEFPVSTSGSGPDQRTVRAIATALADAEAPVIVAGTRAGKACLQAAADVAWALREAGVEARLSLTAPACNSLGLALLEPRPLRELPEADVAVVLEHDLREPALLDRYERVIALDHLPTLTTQCADLVLPAGTFAETAGTLVSSEGRAQRFFAVHPPTHPVRASWRWLAVLSGSDEPVLDDLLADLEEHHPALRGVAAAAEPAGYRRHGERVPRMTHRYSGRTAKDAHRTLTEPRAPEDPDSPLAWSMEGATEPAPPSLRSFVRDPGWNSPNAVLPVEAARGSETGGPPGVRLIEPAEGRPDLDEPPPPFAPDTLWVVEAPQVFGGEELSRRSPSVAERADAPWVGLSAADAEQHGVAEGDEITLRLGDRAVTRPVRLERLPRGLARLPRLSADDDRLPLPAPATAEAP